MAAKKSPAAKSSKNAARSSRSERAVANRSTRRVAEADNVVTMDRRRKLRRAEQNEDAEETPVALERRTKVQRRRQIDPTTCERDYSVEEVEFMNAMDDYKRKSGRMFPTCSEVLEVIRSLGYAKLSQNERALLDTEQTLSERLEAVTETVDALVDARE